MKLPNCLFMAMPMLALLAAPPSAQAQQPYRNVVNQRFRTVGNGPQSALIVDVNDANDRAAVRKSAMQTYSAYLQANLPAIQKEMAFLQARHLVKPGQPLGLTSAVMVRQNGRLVPPAPTRGITRAGNELTFTFPTTGEGAWSASDAQALGTMANTIYAELENNVLGHPGWNGNVTVLNEDPRLGKVDEVIGALLVVNGSNVEILFPTFSAYETQFLAMAQVMAQAFHGPLRIGYDAWEQGMGRAAAVVAARDLQPQITTAGQSVNPANGFYYTPDYDLLNQPPLGNNTFTPPTKSDQTFSATTLSGMLVPRLQMASTAWLKCFIENPNFFKAFNAAYYPVVTAAPGLANDVPTLRNLAAGVLPNVEMLPFDNWYEQQYVLDTSIIPGPKLYAYTQPTFPSAAGGDAGMAAFVIYYNTTSGGDETDLNGTGNVVYWDYTYQNRLALPSFETVNISSGFGTVSPFFTNIGGDPTLNGAMRVAVDFPVNKEYVRVNFPANETGTEAAPNDFSGVLVGADKGTLTVTYQGGSNSIVTQVAQGAFGIGGQGGKVPNGFSTTKLVYAPTAGTGGSPITYQRNTAFNNTFGVAPVFVLAAPGPTDSIPHTFNTGPQMISLPIRPLNGNMALALGIPSNTALLAQYRQDASGDKYLRFPSLPLYEPGYSLWSNFGSGVTATIVGERTDIQPSLSIPLQFGWNQIATPYNTNLDVTADITFQYLGGDVLSLSDAVTRGWVATGVIAYSTGGGYEDITSTPPPADVSANILEAWKGYWIRVLVTEGLTITYTNPNSRAATLTGRAASPTRAAAPSQSNGWRIPLTLQDADGHATSAVFGQAPNGSDSFVAALDVASPPPFTRAATLAVRFPHTDWDTAQGGTGGDFLSDIRRSAASAQWNMVVTVPQPGQTYTLSWANTALLPRGTRLTITDPASGTRQLMNSSSSLTFRTGQGEVTRSFQIQVEPHALGRLRIANINAVIPLTRGRGVSSVTLSYELSSAAETQIEIHSGVRTVRHIAPGRAAASGVNQVVWDMRDDQGRILPAGPYTVYITAHTPDGEQTRAIAPLLLTR